MKGLQKESPIDLNLLPDGQKFERVLTHIRIEPP